jgi:hypothetical protein
MKALGRDFPQKIVDWSGFFEDFSRKALWQAAIQAPLPSIFS